MKKVNVLVFPCGSEVGLEIHRSLKDVPWINLFGASHRSDHGAFVFDIFHLLKIPIDCGGVAEIIELCKSLEIDYIFPAHDAVLLPLKRAQLLSNLVISPEYLVCELFRSKECTYNYFPGLSPGKKTFPLFVKPDSGYGSQYGRIVENENELGAAILEIPSSHSVREYLPGVEYTVDCFTNKYGKLLFFEGRSRERVRTGISCFTEHVEDDWFEGFARSINSNVRMRGAWFFQVKRDRNGALMLLEVGTRIAGSSGIWRGRGINLSLATLLDFMGEEVDHLFSGIDVRGAQMSRALDTVFGKLLMDEKG